MRYRVTHTTRYDYGQPVVLCHNEARLQPRQTPQQSCWQSVVTVDPVPAERAERVDFFGNRVLYFAVQDPHDRLTVTASSDVDVAARDALDDVAAPAWDRVRAHMQGSSPESTSANAGGQEGALPASMRQPKASQEGAGADPEQPVVQARQFILDSACAAASPAAAAYAAPSFPPGRPILAAVHDLNRRIHREFRFDPESTTVVTPVSEVLVQRHGVCQDFAHLAIACLRSLGLPARYVSGYLETTAPPGAERPQGADASHAWFAVFVPGNGWVDFDPTNDCRPGDRHVTTAWGRDYADVTPLKGVIFGGGTHRLDVSVDMVRA
jgi:transglutaminase-like putative cysteine protease